jgi:hypothetical protein
MPVVISGTDGITSPTITTTGVIVSGTTVADATAVIRPLVSATAQASTSGTSIDFTSIPSWAKRITVMFNGVSTSGTSNFQIRLGSSGGVEATGYISSANYSTNTSAAASTGFFILYGIAAAADTFQGSLILSNLSGNAWVGNGNFTDSAQRASNSAGSKTVSGTLDRVRITTVNGTDTFDAGSINILYE